MTTITTTGYQRDVQGHWIEKDSSAVLTYSMDWTDWLVGDDTIATVEYTVTPSPTANDVKIASSGVQGGFITYARLNKGINNTTYSVAAKVTTANGLVDTRRFRIKVKDRYL
jgi:hypothetical protein